MNKLRIYTLALVLTALGLGVFSYKVFYLGFPLTPKTKAQVWHVEARLRFEADGGPVKVNMFLPLNSGQFAFTDEHFISTGYGLNASIESGVRSAVWSARKASGTQNLYYQATVRMTRKKQSKSVVKQPEPSNPDFKGPKLAAAESLIEKIKPRSADASSFVKELLKRLNAPNPDDNVRLLLGKKTGQRNLVEMAVRVLIQAGIDARSVHGIHLDEDKLDFSKKAGLLHWLEVYDKNKWLTFEVPSGSSPVPEDWLPWWRGDGNLAQLQGGSKLNTVLSISPKIDEGISSVAYRGEISKPLLLKFSLFSLPVNTQAVFRILLTIPIGAFLLVILRNVVGVKTFGTFMPVLIALAFRETGLIWGVLLFSVVVALGLVTRFYLEKLKLLVVPRLAAVLIVVVLLILGLSILTHSLGIHRGLSMALFPLVILTMTIERMSIVWEERGAAESLLSGLGSIFAAALAFIAMNNKLLEHLVFVFPELLLVLLAATLLLGRYSGYRLTDLYRFKALANG
ncbi:MAG: UUP1 family membrane protein [Deltaproteobacteria bacterium]|nr:UUP1 family membrane protein [Deltaproteobacteria bacterium]